MIGTHPESLTSEFSPIEDHPVRLNESNVRSSKPIEFSGNASPKEGSTICAVPGVTTGKYTRLEEALAVRAISDTPLCRKDIYQGVIHNSH